MRFLRKNTAVRISVGPFLDFSDGVTPENSLTVADITCELIYDDDDNTAVNRSALTLTASGGNNDMVPVTSTAVGMYDLELTASNTNIGPGRMMLVFSDPDAHVPVWHEFQVLDQAVYDTMYSTGTDVITNTVNDAGATATVFDTDLDTEYTTDDALIGRVIVFEGDTTGALKGQAATITDYAATNGQITVGSGALTTAPATGDTFRIY